MFSKATGAGAALRAMHFFADNERVPQQAAALSSGDFREISYIDIRIRYLIMDTSQKHLPRITSGKATGSSWTCRIIGISSWHGSLSRSRRRIRRNYSGICSERYAGRLCQKDGRIVRTGFMQRSSNQEYTGV